MSRRLPHGAGLLALIVLLIALAVAGCGGSDSASSSSDGLDPATVVPADAAVYVQATVRPSGDMQAGVLAAARKVLRVDDPGAELHRLIDEALADTDLAGTPSFERDIDPWLGDRVGVFVLPDRGDDPVAGFAAAVRDRDALEQELARLRDAGELRTGGRDSGVSYDVTNDDEPVGIVGDFVVFASTQQAFSAAIDASKGSSLADASRFTDAVGDVPDDALAFAYVDPKTLFDAVGGLVDVPPATRRALDRFADSGAVTASLTATADEIAIEASAGGQVTEALDSDSDAEVTVGQLPGDSWLALATPPLGPLIRNVLAGAGVHDEAAAQVQQNVGLDLDRDLLEPLGGLGVFVRGESPLDIGGGALLQMTNAVAAQRLLTRIEAIVGAGLNVPTRPLAVSGARGFQVQIPQSPQPIVVLAKGDRLAAGYAASSAQDLLDPQQRFDDSSDGKAAIDTLGDGYTPSFVLIVPPLAGLLRALDQLEVADLSSVLPYVDAYRSLAIGTKRDGDRTSVRIVAALR
ncbi:MAG TPA: DUF3352 domain-containing protein [Conexibacter sp.]|nr:DUF3352 domain-containing protein [Conexibacter sp.]